MSKISVNYYNIVIFCFSIIQNFLLCCFDAYFKFYVVTSENCQTFESVLFSDNGVLIKFISSSGQFNIKSN